MDKRLLWIGVGIVVITTTSVVLWNQLRPDSLHRPQNMAIETQSLGCASLPAPTQAVFAEALLTDLDRNGAPDALLGWGLQGNGGIYSHKSVWTDLKGAFYEVPAEVALPGLNQVDPTLLPLREIVGRAGGQATQLYRENNRWRTEPAIPSARPQISTVEWADRDGDRLYDMAVVFVRGRAQAHLIPDAQGRWRSQPSTKPPAVHLVQVDDIIPVGLAVVTRLWLGDLDGDGKPEQFDIPGRAVCLSNGKKVAFPLPQAVGELIFTANLDGQSPPELVYLNPNDFARNTLEISVYRYERGRFDQIAHQRRAVSLLNAYVRDLNRDGQDELVLGVLVNHGQEVELCLTTLVGNQLIQQSRRVKTPSSWRARQQRTRVAPTPDTLFFKAREPVGWQRCEFRSVALLVGLPAEPAQATDLNQWRLLITEGEPVWAGDYDQDGLSEYVLGDPKTGRGGRIAQYRAGVWRAASLRRRASLIAALAIPDPAAPYLAVFYSDGALESVRIAR